MSKITITAIVLNEIARIRPWLVQASYWADEIVVFDKGSSDGTAEISTEFGARVVQIPFSEIGHEDWVSMSKVIRTPWFTWSTPAEMFTPNLIKVFKHVTSNDDQVTDTYAVVNKVYSFGSHNPKIEMGKHWVSKLFHVERISFQNKLHDYWVSRGHRKFVRDVDGLTHVLHLAQPNYLNFVRRTLAYTDMEVLHAGDNLEGRAKEAILRANSLDFEFLSGGEGHDIRQALAWKISNLMTALACLDKRLEPQTASRYENIKDQYLAMWEHRNQK